MYALRSDTDHRRFTCRRRHFRASRRNARETVSIVGYGTSSGILNQGDDVLVRRDYSPVLRQAELHSVTIPCWASPASAPPSCRPWVSRATTPCSRSRFLGWHRLVVDRPAAYVDDEFQGATHGFGVGGEAAHLGAGQIPALDARYAWLIHPDPIGELLLRQARSTAQVRQAVCSRFGEDLITAPSDSGLIGRPLRAYLL